MISTVKTHELKIHPEWFAQVRDGVLPAQVRLNDRSFRSNDIVLLMEWVPDEFGKGGRYTGNEMERRIDNVFEDFPGVQDGYVLFTMLAVVS